MPIPMPQLPYAESALEPHISARTLSYHFGKHHKSYVEKANKLIAGTELDSMPLEKIVLAVAQGAPGADQAIFNNAAQAWNHDFFWRSMSPQGGGAPSGAVATLIERSFGSYDGFRKAFIDAGTSLFGSGWVWLAMDGAKLQIEKTQNANSPLVERREPLLVLDVWEHAYYLDYQNARPKFVETFVDKLINWQFAATNLGEDA